MPTAVQVANALAGRYGPPSLRCRFNWYSPLFAYSGNISNAFLQTGELTLDCTRPVRRTANLTVLPDSLPPAFDYLTDYVQIVAQLIEPVTNQTVEYSLGYFLLDDPSEGHDSSGTPIWTVSAADISVKLVAANLGGSYVVPAGSNYVTTIENILGTTLGFQHSIPPDPRVTPVDRVWPWQTYYSTILTDLCDGINYHYPWADANGVFRSRPRIDPSTETPAWQSSTTMEPRMIVERWNRDLASRFSTLGFDNRAVVKISDPARAPMAVEATNDDPTSPISRPIRNLTRTKEVAIDFIADQATQYETAKYIVWDAACRSLTGRLLTLPDLRRDAHEFYSLTIGTVEAGTLWRVRNWTLPLDFQGPMQHILESAAAVEVGTAVVVV